jgi:hypothetical protein
MLLDDASDWPTVTIGELAKATTAPPVEFSDVVKV